MSLIDATFMKAGREISASVKTIKLTEAIEDAEMQDLRPLLGDRLYYDIVQNPAITTRGNYPELLAGSDYTYADYNYSQPGIKNVLRDFATARYRYFGSDTDTPFGYVEKNLQGSTNLNNDQKLKAYNNLRKVALSKWYQVKNYILRQLGTDNEFEYYEYPIEEINSNEGGIVMNTFTIY